MPNRRRYPPHGLWGLTRLAYLWVASSSSSSNIQRSCWGVRVGVCVWDGVTDELDDRSEDEAADEVQG